VVLSVCACACVCVRARARACCEWVTYGGCVPLHKTFDRCLRQRLLTLRALEQSNNLSQHGAGSSSFRLDFNVPLLAHGASEHGTASVLVKRNTLSSHTRFIDRTSAANDNAVHGDLVTGAHLR
jgi:hypothetical protein